MPRVRTWAAEQTGTFCNPCSGLTSTSTRPVDFCTDAEQQKGNFPKGAGGNTYLLPADFCFPPRKFSKSITGSPLWPSRRAAQLPLGAFFGGGCEGLAQSKALRGVRAPAVCTGAGRALPPRSFLTRGKERDLNWEKPKPLLCSSPPPAPICFPVPSCRCLCAKAAVSLGAGKAKSASSALLGSLLAAVKPAAVLLQPRQC